jgi:putative DNA primase/helicase
MGYTLFPEMPRHKIFWFFGLGRNGKGRVIKTLEHILGEKNCSNVELKEFDGEHRFAVASLYGCLINVSSEPVSDNILETSLLKRITGEDVIDAEVKNKQKRLRFLNVAKPFVLGNRFPKVKDLTTGFWDRVELLKFPNSFTGKEQVTNIEKTWLSDPNEVSGILNWMLEGSTRLRKNNDFSSSKSTNDMKIEFKRLSDSVAAWLDDNCVFGVDYHILRSVSFEDYKNYCVTIQTTPISDRQFYDRLRNTPMIREHESTFKNTTERRVWLGLCLKSDEEKQKKLHAITREEPKTKPTFHVKDYVVDGSVEQKCDCGKFAVTKEILTPNGDTLKRCESCLTKLRLQFSEANWE